MRNFILYLLILLVLAYTSVLYGNADLLLLVFGGAGLLGLAYLYIGIQMFFLKVGITLPISMVEQGGGTELVIQTVNRGILPASKLRFCLRCRNSLTGKKKRLTLEGEAAVRKTTQHFYTVAGEHCGCLEYTLERIRIYDLTGIFYLTKRDRQKVELQVMPRIYATAVQVTEWARNFIGEAEEYEDGRSGPDASEVFALRPFRDGDRIQNIHWKLSAKEDELIVRENSMPLGCPVALLLDLGGTIREADGVLTVAASISCALVEQKCAHYIAWYDEQEGDMVRMRVAGEEEVYQFLLQLYMEDVRRQRVRPNIEEIGHMYREKYRMECAAEEISISRNLELKSGERICVKIDGQRLEQALSEVELVV